jgi:hypothetical protein
VVCFDLLSLVDSCPWWIEKGHFLCDYFWLNDPFHPGCIYSGRKVIFTYNHNFNAFACSSNGFEKADRYKRQLEKLETDNPAVSQSLLMPIFINGKRRKWTRLHIELRCTLSLLFLVANILRCRVAPRFSIHVANVTNVQTGPRESQQPQRQPLKLRQKYQRKQRTTQQ